MSLPRRSAFRAWSTQACSTAACSAPHPQRWRPLARTLCAMAGKPAGSRWGAAAMACRAAGRSACSCAARRPRAGPAAGRTPDIALGRRLLGKFARQQEEPRRQESQVHQRASDLVDRPRHAWPAVPGRLEGPGLTAIQAACSGQQVGTGARGAGACRLTASSAQGAPQAQASLLTWHGFWRGARGLCGRRER